jgi:MinD superfamily P-loop ATPase
MEKPAADTANMATSGLREYVIISGKGGTGKTSITASFAVLAGDAVIADCDVDAADLHLVLKPVVKRREIFKSGHEAVIQGQLCTGCGLCRDMCRFDAVTCDDRENRYSIDPLACEGCAVCVHFCPAEAIAFPERICGEWFASETRCGPMVHARLGIAAENSGKLVARVREQARIAARESGRNLLLVDGPPGIGCPVIASITGSDAVLIVTEPTLSGEHDLGRALSLVRHFGLPAAVCVNKYDINLEMTERIEHLAEQEGALPVGRVRYDGSVTRAQLEARAVVEGDGGAGKDIEKLWENLLACWPRVSRTK